MRTLLLIVAVVTIANLFSSLLVLRSDAFSRTQRLVQLLVIWFVPLLGALFCGVFAFHLRSIPAAKGSIDPLYIPSDGGAPEGPGIGLCGCSGSGSGDGGGD